MKAKIELGLEGAFKVDLYSGKKLVESTDFFSNFITPTGLMYPTIYSFADCFRYLSLGSGSLVNRGSLALGVMGTTGLNLPITGFQTSISGPSGIQVPQWIGWQGYETGSNGNDSACGTQITAAGPRLFRSWSIPTGDDSVTVQTNSAIGGLMVNEFMVSPSSGADPTGACAFSRVIRNLFIPDGFKAIITYQLKVNIANTGIVTFHSGTFATGNAEISEDAGIISQWANLSGYYRQVYHGLRCVDSAGATFIPKYGDGMEPSCKNIQALAFYLSPDNSQFDVNSSGGANSDEPSAYAADGLMASIKSLEMDNIFAFNEFSVDNLDTIYNNNNPDISSSFPADITPINIRLGDEGTFLSVPSTSDYQTVTVPSTFNYQDRQDNGNLDVSYATPGSSGFNPSIENYGQRAVFSTKTIRVPLSTGVNLGQNLVTGRLKTVTRKSFFSPVSSLGYNTRFGSLVYAYRTATSASLGTRQYYPYIDCLFFDTSGRSTMQHYRYITGVQLVERGSGILQCQMFIQPAPTTNIQKFINYSTFQGPYSAPFSHFVLSGSPIMGNYFDSTNCPTGFLFNGNLNANAYGYGGGATGDSFGTTGNNGWGSVYGIVVDERFCYCPPDLGLADHSLQNLLAPSTTGIIGWPMYYPKGAPILVRASGLTFWDVGMPAIADTGNWFGTNQIVRNIYFDVVQSGNLGNIITPANFRKFVTVEPPTDDLTIGYYLTNQQFTGNSFTDASILAYDSSPITGYVVTNAVAISANSLQGTVWKGSLPSTSARRQFSPQVMYEDNTFTPPAPLGASSAARVTGMFLNFTERGFPNGINGTPFADGQIYNAFFTGFNYVTSKPYFVTAIKSANRAVGPLTGYSLLSGNVKLTQFKAPSGLAMHDDGLNSASGYRLLPNYGAPNYYQSDAYPATQGGGLPALSMDNGLEIYLDIVWSSTSGTASNCYDPIYPVQT